MRSLLLRLLPLLLLAGLSINPARSGDVKPDDRVAYRQAVMDATAKEMKASGLITKGLIDRPTDLVAHATALHEQAMILGDLFPAGTGPDKVKTGAKAEIWTQADKFQAAVKTFQTETQAFVDTAKAGNIDATRAQMGKVGESCGGCHDTFRVDEH
jgi:cytochrome c556